MLGTLPPRDLWLLPLVSFLTLVLLLVGAEAMSRLVWPYQMENECRQPDKTLGFRYRSNCKATMKSVEGPWYASEYNECGYRSPASCGRVSAGTRRIALIGSSISEGYLVEYPNTIAARLQSELQAMCAAPIDIQNLGGTGYSGQYLVLRMEEALRLAPDAVLLVVLPFDVHDQIANSATFAASAGSEGTAQPRLDGSLRQSLISWSRESRAVTMAQHYLFQDPATYVPLILRSGDNTDFLRPPFTPAWEARLRVFDGLIGQLADRARAAGVPFMLAFVPNQVQAILGATHSLPAGIDTRALPDALAEIARAHGADFADTSASLAAAPKPGLLYYQVDGHPSGKGQPLIARSIAQTYTSLTHGPFSNCNVSTARPGTTP